MRFAVLSMIASESDRDRSRSTWPALNRFCNRFDLRPGFIDLGMDGTWEDKFNLIRSFLQEFDRILYVDPTVLLRFDCPNLFEVVPDDSIGMFEQGDLEPERKKAEGLGSLYNPFVIVASKEHLEFFSPGRVVDSSSFNLFKLPHRFNRLPKTVPVTGEQLEDSFAVNLSESSLGLTREIAEKFNHFREYGVPKFFKRIMIDMPGALGDCVAMEPLVRYLICELEPTARVTVRTSFPDVFEHIRIVRTEGSFRCVPEDWDRGQAYCHINLAHRFDRASFNLMHPLDYGGLCAFGGHVPAEHRSIRLTSKHSMNMVSGHILIHAGASWPSKTFPSDFWQSVIDKLIDDGHKIALIGKTYSDGVRGTVPIDGSRCLDLRNRLSLSELIAAIRDSKMLISNDSSPVHISGAFLNPTIMITSAKQPEFIWPKRESILNINLGSPLPNAYPKIGLANSTRIDECSLEDLRSILPTAEDVARKVESFFLEY